MSSTLAACNLLLMMLGWFLGHVFGHTHTHILLTDPAIPPNSGREMQIVGQKTYK